MMDSVRKHKFRSVVVYRLDRISRNIGDFAGLIEELGSLNVSFVSIREQFDTGSPMGRAMMYIASVFSQLERETIAERIRDNMLELAKTGRWLGGVTPTGYSSKRIAVSKKEDGKERWAYRLTLLPEEAETVKLIFDKYNDFNSLTKVEAELLRRRIKTRKGNEYTRFSIRGILQNPVYMIADEAAYRYFSEQGAEIYSLRSEFDGKHGIAVYNRTRQEKGKATEVRPLNDWIVSVGRHKGIIPSDSWIRAQNNLEKNKSRSYRKPRKNNALLSGVLFCKCGSRMYPKLSERYNEQGNRLYSYMCLRKDRSRGGLCDCRNPNGNALDAAVVEQLKQLKEDGPAFTARLKNGVNLLCKKGTDCENALVELRLALNASEAKMTALIDSLAGAGSQEARKRICSRIEELDGEAEVIKTEIAELEDQSKACLLSLSEYDALTDKLPEFSNAVDTLNTDQKRSLIKYLVNKLVWDGEKVNMYLYGAIGCEERS